VGGIISVKYQFVVGVSQSNQRSDFCAEYTCFLFLFFFSVLEFELMASYLPNECSISPFNSGHFEIGSHFLPRLAWTMILF
jgi:hypothetical protein